MKKLLLIFFIVGCSSIPKKENLVKKLEKPVKKVKVELPIKYKIKPGEVQKISFPVLGEKLSQGKLFCKDRYFKTHMKNGFRTAYVSETYFSRKEEYSCFLELEKEKIEVVRFSIQDKIFPSERLFVDKRRVFVSKKNLERVRSEQAVLNKVYDSSPSFPLFREGFQKPIDSFVTSIYGSKRVFNKKKQTQHLGTDFRARVGTPISAASDGVVVISRNLFYTGKTIIIDHGLGIFTVYGHLSKLNFQEGDKIKKGQELGLSGATGRVTGPHLHWGVKINGHYIEGDSLIKVTNDKI